MTKNSEIDTLKLEALGTVIVACFWLILSLVLFAACVVNVVGLLVIGSDEQTARIALIGSQAALCWISKRKSDEMLLKNKVKLVQLDAAKRKAGVK